MYRNSDGYYDLLPKVLYMNVRSRRGDLRNRPQSPSHDDV
jgi:hypothetical protein